MNGQEDDQHLVDAAEYVTEVRDPHNARGDGIDTGKFNSSSREETLSVSTDQVVDSSSSYVESSAEAASTQLLSRVATGIPTESSNAGHKEKISVTNSANSVGDAGEATSRVEITPVQPPGLAEPMEKDEFLREILDSIGDVELMLNQPRFAGSNFPRSGKFDSFYHRRDSDD